MTTRADVIDGFMRKAAALCAELGIEVPHLLVAYATEWHRLGIGLEFCWRRVEFTLRNDRGLGELDDWLRKRRAQRILASKPPQAGPCEEPSEPLQLTPEPEPHVEPPQGQPATKADKVRQLLRETAGRGPYRQSSESGWQGRTDSCARISRSAGAAHSAEWQRSWES
jgi:hypothetical protein